MMMRVIVLCFDINDESNYNETDNYDEANYDDDDNLPSAINGKYSDTVITMMKQIMTMTLIAKRTTPKMSIKRIWQQKIYPWGKPCI